VADPVTTDPTARDVTNGRELRESEAFVGLEGIARPLRAAPAPVGSAWNDAPSSSWWSTGAYRRIAARPRVVSNWVWTILLMALDGTMALLAALAGSAVRFGDTPPQVVRGVPYLAYAAALAVIWIGAMLLGRTYDRRYLAAGAEQFRRVANSAVWVLGLIAFASFVLRADLSRGFVAITIPTATALTLLARFCARSCCDAPRDCCRRSVGH
jgi:hypothetical protein